MVGSRSVTKRYESLKKAFDSDGFQVVNLKKDDRYKQLDWITPQGYFEYQGKIGLMAVHKTARNYRTQEQKKVYYLEGDSEQMGFLLGLMAESEIYRMTTEFVENVVFDFFDLEKIVKSSPLVDYVKGQFADLLGKACLEEIREDVPRAYINEINALHWGCHSVNPKS